MVMVVIKGEEEGNKENDYPHPNLLYAGATNATKQRNKYEQAKSPDRSVILLSHDKRRTIGNARGAVVCSHAQQSQSEKYHMPRKHSGSTLTNQRKHQWH